MSNDGQAQTPMSDHIASFWRLLAAEHVRILIDIRRDHDEGQPPHWDSSSFGNEVAKALVADRAAPSSPVVGREEIEAILFRRVVQNRMAGYTMEAAEEILAALSAKPAKGDGVTAPCRFCNDTKRALYFSEQGWTQEERDCHICSMPSAEALTPRQLALAGEFVKEGHPMETAILMARDPACSMPSAQSKSEAT